MSEVCEAFHCTPSEARKQDWAEVQAIFDYRNAKAALEMFNQGGKGREELAKHPALMNLLLEMKRAQLEDDSVTMLDLMGAGDG